MSPRIVLTSLLTLLCLPLLLGSCSSSRGGGGSSFVVGETYYTQTNLHADPRGRLYTVNYQQALLIPIGSEVRVEAVNRKRMQFTLLDQGRKFDYVLDRNTPEPLDTNLQKYFGRERVNDRIASLSELDQEGIRTGIAQVGMSKEGVRLALGDPPSHGTPTLASPVWTYWKNRWVTKTIAFDADGIVTSIQG